MPMTCLELDPLVTPFVDGECTDAQRSLVLTHLRECADCASRVEAELTAKHVLHAQATIARTMGVTPSWRPRVYRLGKPSLPVRPGVLLLFGLIGAGLLFMLFRPTPVLAVGVVSDSFCAMQHRFTERFKVDGHTCTLGCVKRGAAFVFVTSTRVYPIHNQEHPDLAALANVRVTMEGTIDGDGIRVSELMPADADDSR
jgi:anti-sigma factor RsiW